MAEQKINIPNFSYPFKNIKDVEKDCYKNLENKPDGNYLFSQQGLWHGGMHFDKSFDPEIKAIADGELVAYRLNKTYLQDEDEEKEDEGLYSSGFFLLKHTLAYPKTNKLTFFSLYMHTAKKDEYNLDTHKVIGEDGKRNLRKGVSYAEADKLEELALGTKITIDPNQTTEEKDKHRYKILYVGDTPRTDGATIHKTNIQALDNVHKLKTITKETKPKEDIQFPTQKIEIKAGEMIGLRGLYTPAKQKKNEVVHIEVFTADDVQKFADKAKEEYAKKDSKDRPQPKTLKIPKDIKEYKKEKIYVVESSAGYTNLRKAYKEGDTGYNHKQITNNGVKLQIDEDSLQHNRYHVLKIEITDVSAQNWSVHKNYIKESYQYIEDTKTQPKDEIVKITDIKKEKNDDKEYLLYNDKVFLYSDTIEQHPITFEWARIIQMQSDDHVSLFQKLSNYLVPSLQSDDLKYNSSYSELFNMIDEDHNGMLEPQELSKAAANKEIKKTIANYIVQHSSEWDDTINMADVILKIYTEHKDTIENFEDIEQHYKNQKERIQKLCFFKECKGIEGFPQNDMVYHLNPVGLVEQFGSQCNIKIEQHLLTSNQYSRPETNVNTIKAIVIHWVANPMSTAMNNRNFFENRKNGQDGYGSAHYIIGLEGEIIQCLPENEMAYHVGAQQYTEYATNNLSSYPNNCTLGIELTHIDWEGKFKEATLDSARCLCRQLLNKYNLTKENIIRHYDVTGKDCPKYFINHEDEFIKFKNSI